MTTSSPMQDARVYRTDRFHVPLSAHREFLEQVHRTHEFLRTLPGLIQDSVFEQIGESGEFNLVTIAVWESDEAIEAAKKAVVAKHEEMGFNPQEMFARLGIKAELATYRKINV
jgi:heme-degrading monooxygenase HmoA